MPKDESVGETEFKHVIDTELSTGNLRFLPEYLRRHYLLQHEKYRAFRNIRIITENGGHRLSYRVLVPETSQYVDVTVDASVPIKVTMELSDPDILKSFLNQLYEDLFLIVQLFEEEMRKTTLYFAFMPGEKVVPESEKSGMLGRIFTESMLPFFIALMALTFLFFWIFDWYAPIILVGLSLMLALFSGKLIARIGNWKVTKDQPEIHLLQYHFSPDKYEEFRKKHAKKISEIRKEIYETTIAVDKPINCEAAGEIFSNYGIDCEPEDFSVKKMNLFEIVKKASDNFGLSMPKIVVTNMIIPNAAAAGPSPKLGTIMVTTGIMTQLEEDELLSVVGHELSHLKAHDPIVMSSLASAEYLLRFYVLLPYLFHFGFISFWIYFLVAIGLIYFFGKFLEGRADLDSAKMIGQPKVMAEALRKIAFKRLFPLYRREPTFRGYRRSEWLRFDPHPPAYFRIARLEKLQEPEKIEHTFFKSVKDSLTGFLRA
ncbi:MAG: M48 family metalloprotease [Candidatus Bathyarchaeota archaeon]|nr:MAG: M48 family metalloprotease [Candidatus Bathyarchaeota archaeon]